MLAHGRTPFVDGQPQRDGQPARTATSSRASPRVLVNQQGLYRARVVFPESGRFEYVIDDGLQPAAHVPAGDRRCGRRRSGARAGLADRGGAWRRRLVGAAGARRSPAAPGSSTAWIVLMLMSRRRARRRRAGARRVRARAPVALPVAAGLAAAAVTFAVVMAVDGRDDEREGAGRRRRARRGLSRPAAARSSSRWAAEAATGSPTTGSTGTIGPDLDERLAGHDRASLSPTILSPPGSGGGTAFTVMPDNFGERMDARELDALVGYLLAARRSPCPSRRLGRCPARTSRHARRPSCRPRAC